MTIEEFYLKNMYSCFIHAVGAGTATAVEANKVVKKCCKASKAFDALLNDVQGYQGSICCYCKNFNNNNCEHFGDLPTEDGIPLQCGKWKWRGAE